MSIARTVKVNFNLDRLAAAAQALGFTVERNAEVIGYYLNSPMQNGKKFPLVIRGKSGRFDAGFTEESLVADFHMNYVNNDMLNKVLPGYYAGMAEENGFSVLDQTETADEIVLRVSR